MVCLPCLLTPLLTAGAGAGMGWYGKNKGEEFVMFIGIILTIISLIWFFRNKDAIDKAKN